MGKRIWNETGFYQGPSLERIDQKGFKDGEDVRFCLPVPLFIFEMPMKRLCPECGVEITHANYISFQRALRAKSLCRQCAGKPSVHVRRLQEAAARREDQPPRGFFAAFFDSLQTGSSAQPE
jgi:hypothetical protein